MRIRHRYPVERMMASDPVTDEYQAEVDAHTARRERDYRDAEKRLRAAELKRDRIRAETVSRSTRKAHARRLAELDALVDLRRNELDALDRQMKASPQSAQHRGKKSYRAVPVTHGTV